MANKRFSDAPWFPNSTSGTFLNSKLSRILQVQIIMSLNDKNPLDGEKSPIYHTEINIPNSGLPKPRFTLEQVVTKVMHKDMEAQTPIEYPPGLKHQRRNTITRLKNVHLRDITHDMPRKVIRNLKPTRIPFVKRVIKWCKQKWKVHFKFSVL